MNTDNIEISAPRRKNSIFASMCLLIILLAMTLNDLPLQQYLGTLGASPLWAVSLIMFVLFVISNKFYLYLDKYGRLFMIYFLVTFSVSLIQCVYYYFAEGTMLNPYGVSVLNKHFFASSYYFFYFLTIYCAGYALLSVSRSFFIKSIIYIAFFLIVIIAIEYVSPSILAPIHLSMDGYEVGSRLRVLSPEPSIAAFTFNIFLLLAIAFSNVSLVRVILWGALLIGNLLIGSKSSLMLMMFGALFVFYFNMTLLQKLKSLILLVPVAGAILYIFINKVLPALAIDIENFTSVSTRLITSLWALCSLLYYPLGEGYGTYTAWFVEPLNSATTLANSLVPFQLNLLEINNMIATGDYLAAKSGILFSIVHSGFLSIIFFFLVFSNAFRDIKISNASHYQKVLLRITLWYSLLSILLAVNMEVLYTFLLPLIVVNYFKKLAVNN
ncbi:MULTISPECIES: hypothetical protein [Enterobacteriaceae]|uniref:hypothetical protein n=1 Tax=Enterobacteriaceae TaxID=543 RepID=UPI000CF16049|nr:MULTISPECIES: hypothetical protein [Enterobacteriaceae]MCU3195202.1 hypothetical protein [Enterobacter hormaechei subsp. hoffmannii]HED2223104.1 hypothetical protein [Enterobacter hormaechei subsp. steigerwaltii]ELM8953713.1 hypothetical protein [Escherichia coli]MCU3508064.1 hypothetical protein [Enterobacter hormaechei subsp. hoffmannii]MCU3984309.1 hypothetical protein [Enterobacter hormaechei subsp. hoffmannii]